MQLKLSVILSVNIYTMATINYYLDKIDKKGFAPIYLRINCNANQIKISTGTKIEVSEFNKELQKVNDTYKGSYEINYYLDFLKSRAHDLLNNNYKKTYSNSEIKKLLAEIIKGYKEDHNVSIVKEQLSLYGKPYTFIDLFAGAGGFSEGFLQADVNNKYFDFLFASDINENCELTHIVRYNHQLSLDTKFLKQDITEPDFIENLQSNIGSNTVDVVCGGPPCQSFSLAGKRRKFDKKDDLFSHYLEVIKILQPKYFVMENVKGILTKEKGKVRELILNKINSIVDIKEIPQLTKFIKGLKETNRDNDFLLNCLIKKVEIEKYSNNKIEDAKKEYIKVIESKFRLLTPKIVDYKTSKTDSRINTIRHGFNLLLRNKNWDKIKRDLIKEKDFCNIDSDYFVDYFNDFLNELSSESIVQKIEKAFNLLNVPSEYQKISDDILLAIKIYTVSFDDTIEYIKEYCNASQLKNLQEILNELRLYKIEAPFIANASNYGVPQNRERVLFIGCRKDQKFISEIPYTVNSDEKVSVFEALYDLDFIGNNEEKRHYELIDISTQFNGSSEKMKSLLRKRNVDGKIEKKGMIFSEWSKKGRLNKRFKNINNPFYVKNHDALQNGEKTYDILHNHKTSKQSPDVVKRLEIILRNKDYKDAQMELNECGLVSKKRNYNVLNPEKQSPTVMTIPDDYIHYNSPRALTVREMARLQSFDDSFVFQGKRSTGGNNRKTEVPQYTLVGNSVPPLLARAIATEILKKIK